MSKTKIVLWKHYLIRKRHWILTLVEVCLPVLIFFLLAYCRSQVDIIKKIDVPEIKHNVKPLEFVDTHLTTILYTPANDITNDLIDRMKEKLQMPTSNVFSFDSEDALLDYYLEENRDKTIGIIFNSFSPNFDYTIRINEKSVMWNTEKLYSPEFFRGYDTVYDSTGFLTVQHALDTAFIEKVGNVSVPLNIELKGIPFPPRVEDVGVSQIYSGVLPHITIFGFLFIIPAVVQRVVEEKQSGIKELQKMVGLKSWMLWLGWFLHGLIPAIFSIIIIVTLMKVPFWGVDYPPIEYTNGVIYFVFLFLYCVSTICFCFFVSTLTSKPTFSMVFSILIWIFSYFIPERILAARGSPKFLKILLAIFPNIAMDHGYKIMAVYEQREVGIQWSNLFELPLGAKNDISMFTVFVLFLCEVLIFIVLTFYVDNINPGVYGVRQPVFYFIRKIKRVLSRSKQVSNDIERVEAANLLKPGIQLMNLTKNFGAYRAVDDLNLHIFKDQITVLLGHNGAGKTTVMHMMTGMIDATKGTILINNKNVKTDMDEIRMSLGLCPQHNLLFQDFTVLEHLLFFAMLKGKSSAEAEKEAESLMEMLKIDKSKNKLASTLSGGMKRKLCLCMAIIGDPKVLILDEPTSGMDPESRREVWDMLKKRRESKTILITTHFLEEADVLGDRIAIMSHGKLLCHDTPHELKKKYNTGYNLSLSLDVNDKKEINEIVKTIKSIADRLSLPLIEIPSFGNKLCYNLCMDDKAKFSKFLGELNNSRDSLRIVGESLTLTKLEDVFLKTLESDSEDGSSKKSYAQGLKETYGKKEHVSIFAPLLKKRLLCFKRRIWFFIVTTVLVGLLFVGNTLLSQNYLFGVNTQIESKIALKLSAYEPGSVYLQASQSFDLIKTDKLVESYEKIVREQGSKPILSENVDDDIIKAGLDNLPYYKKNIIAGAMFNFENTVGAMYSFGALHSAPISVNLITNTIARSILGDGYSISTSSWPLAPRQTSEDEPVMLSEPQVKLIWSFLYPIGIILLLCPFIIYPFEEMSTKFTTIQFMAGVKPFKYWLVNCLSDSSILLVEIVLILVLQVFQLVVDFHLFYRAKVICAFLILTTILITTSLPYVYLFSRRRTLSGGVALFIILNMFLGIIPFIIIAVMLISGSSYWKQVGESLDFLFLIVCPPYGYTKIGNYFSQQTTRLYNWNEMSPLERKIECRNDQNMPCCKNDLKLCSEYTSYLNPSHTLVLDMFLILLGMVLYLVLNVVLDLYYKQIAEKFHRQYYTMLNFAKPHQMDSTREEHRTDEDENDSNIVGKNYNFEARNLKKSYNLNKRVVNIEKLRATKGKCLGFLGVNGAGKTTTFNIITKQIMNDDPKGKIWIRNKEGNEKNDNYLEKLGYCPQSDCLNFILTARESLSFMAALRGVEDVDKTVSKYIQLFDLEDHQSKIIKTYSGGNKRKVCAALSLIGINDVTLLDEPTTGIDAKSKRNFWNILKTHQYENLLTTILTSHSMDECEALCDKLIILKDGEIKKEETISKLKEEIMGYVVNFKLKIDKKSYDEVDGCSTIVSGSGETYKKNEYDEFKKHIVERNYELRDEHLGSLQYSVKTQKRLSELFEEVEGIAQTYPIVEDYSISESSVEDVFLNVARN